TGRLSLSLRGTEDDAEVGRVELDQRLFLGLDAVIAPEPVARSCTIRTRRGSEVVEIEVPCPPGG
ncbi:MAG: Flp pilus assembly protein CpaB, partial [Rhodobacteraceae bacterium]|nr:Flp pilus assembly protein CpaB [Paracoccaceae bacterium]